MFDNRFPSLTSAGQQSNRTRADRADRACIGALRSRGVRKDQTPLGAKPLAHIELLLEVLADRTDVLGQRADVNYVLPSRIAAPRSASRCIIRTGRFMRTRWCRRCRRACTNWRPSITPKTGRGVLQTLIEAERSAGSRMLYEGTHAVAFVPVCARYPYEVWVAPVQPVQDFTALSTEQRADVARALKTVLMKYDGLWQRPFPYVMAWYQAPTDGKRISAIASARTVFSAVPHARPAEISGRHRDCRRFFRNGCAA